MAEKATIARPYAKAAFEHARAGNSFPRWSQLLAAAAQVVADARVAKLLADPRVTSEDLAGLVADIARTADDEDGLNFIRALAANHRLGFLPEIAAAYETLRAEVENTADVQVISAVALDDEQRARLAAALAKRFKREVRLHCEVDASLLGGAIVRSLDLVIDGSLRSQLERLAAEMTR
jgi:F-type H+-transporting ATPase subunit delta